MPVRYRRRTLATPLAAAARAFPAIVLTGPRRAGKTFLLRHAFPTASYVLLEDPDVVARLRADPQGFLDGLEGLCILDEIQHVPEVFAHVRARIDRTPSRRLRWILTGSQEAPLMQGVSESLAGRAAVFQLWPFALAESPRVSPLRGGFPEVLEGRGPARVWFSSYVQTYLERDVRSVTNVRDLATFRRFLGLVASRHGQLLNRNDIAAPLGVSVPTVSQWLGILEITGQILLVPPYFENLGKRLVKSPRLYVADAGLACHLLGIETAAELARSPFRGAIFEGFVAGEIVKRQIHGGGRREIYGFRDEQGLEVDFIVPGKNGVLHLVECKAGRTVTPQMASPLLRLAAAMRARRPDVGVESVIVHEPGAGGVRTSAVAEGVRAVDWRTWLQARG
jgi:predicted AAA+ superfamily ATPase